MFISVAVYCFSNFPRVHVSNKSPTIQIRFRDIPFVKDEKDQTP